MNALENVYNIGYLDGRNHVLALLSLLWSKKKKPENDSSYALYKNEIFMVLSAV